MQEKPPISTFIRINHDLLSPADALKVLEGILANQTSQKHWETFNISPFFHDTLLITGKGPFVVPELQHQVIVSISCGIALLRGADLFQAGILAITQSANLGDNVSVYIDLDDKCLRGYALVYPGNKYHVGNGILKASRSDIFSHSSKELTGKGIGVLMNNPIYRMPCLGNLESQGLYLQNLPSILVGHIMDPQPNDTILDMCCCPGGKSIHFAQLSSDCHVISIDRSNQKILKFKTRINNLKIKNITAITGNSATCEPIQINAKDFDWKIYDSKIPKNQKIQLPMFQKILLDAPCSGYGQRPCFNTNHEESKKLINECASYQQSLLKSAYRLLQDNGILVYSTCSESKHENMANIEWFLDAHKDMKIMDKKLNIGNGEITQSIYEFSQNAVYNDYGCEWESIGFFIVQMQKKTISCR